MTQASSRLEIISIFGKISLSMNKYNSLNEHLYENERKSFFGIKKTLLLNKKNQVFENRATHTHFSTPAHGNVYTQIGKAYKILTFTSKNSK
jgi:hypothetical protein